MINNIIVFKDLSIFFKNLVADGINAYPNEDFSQYVNFETQEPTFMAEEAAVPSHLIVISFDALQKSQC